MNRTLLAVCFFFAVGVAHAGILPSANPNRAYPPSCLPGALPTQPTGVVRDRYVTLPTIPQVASAPPSEQVYVAFWRVACSETRSALLMKIKRLALNGRTDVWLRAPVLRFRQADIDFRDAGGRDLVRYVEESNTRSTATMDGAGIINETTYVIEHPLDAPVALDFNKAFTVNVTSSATDLNGWLIDVPAYAPTPATYPDAFLPQVISGYHGALYIQPNHPGFSLNIAVYDQADPDVKVVMAGWNFRDAAGQQWYLGQSGTIRPGDRRANIIQLMYNDGSLPVPLKWGDAVLEWDSCNTLRMTSTPYPDLPPGVPNQAKTETWTRVAPFNALPCE